MLEDAVFFFEIGDSCRQLHRVFALDDLPSHGKRKLPEIFSDYYNRFPDGLINNRFGVEHADFTTPEYAAWRSLRESEDSRYIGLTMPRFLSRLPYGAATEPVAPESR